MSPAARRIKPWLIVFVRAPRYGAVKHRLAAGIGAAAAWRFYRRCGADVARRLGGDRRWVTVLAVTPDRFARQGRFWPGHLPRIAQGPGDLGQRLSRALGSGPRRPVVIVGSDIPALTRRHVAAAFAALGRDHAVVGPAADGGYWLIGLRHGLRPAADRGPAGRLDLFAKVRWSSGHALADTLANFARRHRVACLERLRDIDTAADYRAWRAAARESPSTRRREGR